MALLRQGTISIYWQVNMIDHITINVVDLEKSKAFYEKVLATLGMKINLGGPPAQFYGFGAADAPEFEIAAGRVFISQSDGEYPVTPSFHIAFRALDHAAVDAFYRVALEAGAKDNGAPGIRADYAENYYAAFVIDPDGNNIEAVCLT